MVIILKNKYSFCRLLFVLVFYTFFSIYDGVMIQVDSSSYIGMELSREFLYPLFLAVLRFLCNGNEIYLFFIVILQGLLAAFCVWSLAEFLCKSFKLPNWMACFLLSVPLLVSLLNRFAAGRSSMYTNSILTEGITLSLYLLLFRYLLDYLQNHQKKHILIAWIISAIMFGMRKQMAVTLVLVAISVLYVMYQQRTLKKGILHIILASMIIFLSTNVCERTYNYFVRGEFVTHASDNRFVMTMLFYTAEREDGLAITDTGIQNLFYEIYDDCDEGGYLMHSAGDGWYENVVHFGDYYDLIQIDTMWPQIRAYAENESTSYIEREQLADDITNIMIAAIFPQVLPKLIHVLFNNFLSGLVTTIAQRNAILIWYALFAYLGYIAILIFHITKKRKLDLATEFSLLTLLSILGNVALVSAVIFCQARYTIYNMPLFYMCFVLMIYLLLRRKQIKTFS